MLNIESVWASEYLTDELVWCGYQALIHHIPCHIPYNLQHNIKQQPSNGCHTALDRFVSGERVEHLLQLWYLCEMKQHDVDKSQLRHFSPILDTMNQKTRILPFWLIFLNENRVFYFTAMLCHSDVMHSKLPWFVYFNLLQIVSSSFTMTMLPTGRPQQLQLLPLWKPSLVNAIEFLVTYLYQDGWIFCNVDCQTFIISISLPV